MYETVQLNDDTLLEVELEMHPINPEDFKGCCFTNDLNSGTIEGVVKGLVGMTTLYCVICDLKRMRIGRMSQYVNIRN